MSGVATATVIAGASLALTAGAVGYSLLSPKPNPQPLQSMTPQGVARTTTEVPQYEDPAIQAAARSQEFAAANAKGRQSTIMTSGLGDTAASTTDKKQLLGVS